MELEIEAHVKQEEALEILTQDNGVAELLYGGAKNGGKSFLGTIFTCGNCMLYPGVHFFVARKELNDLRKFTLPTIHKWFRSINLKFENYAHYNGQDNYIQFYNGSRLYFLAATYLPSDPMFERFGSMEFTGGWLEEGGELDVLAYENIKLSIGRWRNDEYKIPYKLLITCNPKKNWMYTDFYKPWSEGKLPPTKAFIQALVTDNAFRESGAVTILDAIKDKITRQRLRFGDWEYVGDPASLMDYDSIISIFTNSHVPAVGAKYMTVDVARYGDDKTKIRIWHGWRVIHVEKISKQSTSFVAQVIKELCLKYGVPPSNVVIDEDGIGGGVVDQVKGSRGFIALAAPVYDRLKTDPMTRKPNESYDCIKTQCGYMLAEKVNQKMIYEPVTDLEDQDRLIQDLEHVKEKNIDNDKKRSLVSKKDIRKQIGRSPDDGDTYIMRMWFELHPKPLIKL